MGKRSRSRRLAAFVNQLEETFEAGTSVQGIDVLDGGGKRLSNFAPGTVLNTVQVGSNTDASATLTTDLRHLVTTYNRVAPDSRILITANCYTQYVEDTDDPGLVMYVQYSYDGGTTWTTLGEAVQHQARFADRGTANYTEGTMTYMTGINATGYDSIMFSLWVQDTGGAANSTKSIFNAQWLFQEVTQ